MYFALGQVEMTPLAMSYHRACRLWCICHIQNGGIQCSGYFAQRIKGGICHASFEIAKESGTQSSGCCKVSETEPKLNAFVLDIGTKSLNLIIRFECIAHSKFSLNLNNCLIQ